MGKPHIWAVLGGVLEGVLLVRLVALLFAARPDNPVVRAILVLSAPLVLPFHGLDRLAQQPQFGARLELATLAAMCVVLIAISGIMWTRQRTRR